MKKNWDESRYGKYLEIMMEYCDFYHPAMKIIENEPANNNDDTANTLFITTVMVTCPIIISYVIWVLKNAEKNNIRVLYFLARDGHVLYKIAKMLSKHYNISIECRYLYCSRQSLRQPLYYVNKVEAMNKLCSYAVKVCPDMVLDKMNFNEKEKQLVFSEIGIGEKGRKEYLTVVGLENLKLKLQESKIFDNLASNKSQAMYEAVIGYLYQEGLISDTNYAIVDSGWAGSVQRSIRILVGSQTLRTTKIRGYYFGLYKSNDKEDGEFLSFYFGPDSNIARGIMFNNSLFECICAANHGMTTGYRYMDNKWQPILKEVNYEERLEERNRIIYSFVIEMMLCNDYHQIKEQHLAEGIKPIVSCFMCNPDEEEAELYGNIPFCDDTTEGYMLPLATKLPYMDLLKELVPLRIFYKFFSKGLFKKNTESFWIEGTIATLPNPLKFIFRINNGIIYLLKTIWKRLKHNYSSER